MQRPGQAGAAWRRQARGLDAMRAGSPARKRGFARLVAAPSLSFLVPCVAGGARGARWWSHDRNRPPRGLLGPSGPVRGRCACPQQAPCRAGRAVPGCLRGTWPSESTHLCDLAQHSAPRDVVSRLVELLSRVLRGHGARLLAGSRLGPRSVRRSPEPSPARSRLAALLPSAVAWSRAALARRELRAGPMRGLRVGHRGACSSDSPRDAPVACRRPVRAGRAILGRVEGPGAKTGWPLQLSRSAFGRSGAKEQPRTPAGGPSGSAEAQQRVCGRRLRAWPVRACKAQPGARARGPLGEAGTRLRVSGSEKEFWA